MRPRALATSAHMAAFLRAMMSLLAEGLQSEGPGPVSSGPLLMAAGCTDMCVVRPGAGRPQTVKLIERCYNRPLRYTPTTVRPATCFIKQAVTPAPSMTNSTQHNNISTSARRCSPSLSATPQSHPPEPGQCQPPQRPDNSLGGSGFLTPMLPPRTSTPTPSRPATTMSTAHPHAIRLGHNHLHQESAAADAAAAAVQGWKQLL